METKAGERSSRAHARRSDEQRIAELQQRISELQARAEAKAAAPESAVLKSIPKLARHLRKFADLAMANGRQDLATSTWAFMAGLERNLGQDEASRRRRGADDDRG